jgi:hypothetical protein
MLRVINNLGSSAPGSMLIRTLAWNPFNDNGTEFEVPAFEATFALTPFEEFAALLSEYSGSEFTQGLFAAFFGFVFPKGTSPQVFIVKIRTIGSIKKDSFFIKIFHLLFQNFFKLTLPGVLPPRLGPDILWPSEDTVRRYRSRMIIPPGSVLL